MADILMATDFSLNKVYQRKCGATPSAGYRFNLLSGILKMLIFWAINGFSLEITAYSSIMAAMMAFVCFCYVLLGQQILKVSQVTVYTLFLMLGGMCVPYVWGAVFLHEQLTAFRIIGLVVIAAALILMNLSERPPKKQILMCVAVFFFERTMQRNLKRTSNIGERNGFHLGICNVDGCGNGIIWIGRNYC